MKIKNKQKILKQLKKVGYIIENVHRFNGRPNSLYVSFDICKSKPTGFYLARIALQKVSIVDELLEVGIGWSERSINKKYPPEKMLSMEDALSGKPGLFMFGCISATYEVGPTEHYSVYHINHPHWNMK